MGDSRRGTEFTRFILRQFPKVKSVCCVADGKGQVARALANKGIRVSVFDPKPRLEGRPHSLISYHREYFSRDTDTTADLIVGMHPDDATAEIILSARRQRKPWAVVPCCVMGPEAKRCGNHKNWIPHLKRLAVECLEAQLHITGKNLCLYQKEIYHAD